MVNQTSGQNFEGLMMMAWPDLPEEVREAARALAEIIEQARKQNNPAPSVRDEEELGDMVNQLVDYVKEHPDQFKIPPALINRLNNDSGLDEALRTAIMVRASRMWPVSRLIYYINGIEEIHCLRHDQWVATVRGKKVMLAPETRPQEFADDEGVVRFFRDNLLALRDAVGDHSLTDSQPLAEATIGSFMRIAVAIKPAINGDSAVNACIRIPSAGHLRNLQDYVQKGVMPLEAASFLEACVKAKANILIAGGTASGKTTLMRVMAGLIPDKETVVVIEDAAELRLKDDRGDGDIDPKTQLRIPRPWVPLCIALNTVQSTIKSDKNEGSVDLRRLVKLSLRFRPQRILLGEARGAEMAEVCVAMTSGHDGSMTTIHADDATDAVNKAADYVMESERYLGNHQLALRAVHRSIDIVVHLREISEGHRVLTGVVALGPEPGHVVPIFALNQDDVLVPQNVTFGDLPPRLRRRLESINWRGLR